VIVTRSFAPFELGADLVATLNSDSEPAPADWTSLSGIDVP
jgi:hypothetical protein